jgi:hypothetical protein
MPSYHSFRDDMHMRGVPEQGTARSSEANPVYKAAAGWVDLIRTLARHVSPVSTPFSHRLNTLAYEMGDASDPQLVSKTRLFVALGGCDALADVFAALPDRLQDIHDMVQTASTPSAGSRLSFAEERRLSTSLTIQRTWEDCAQRALVAMREVAYTLQRLAVDDRQAAGGPAFVAKLVRLLAHPVVGANAAEALDELLPGAGRVFSVRELELHGGALLPTLLQASARELAGTARFLSMLAFDTFKQDPSAVPGAVRMLRRAYEGAIHRPELVKAFVQGVPAPQQGLGQGWASGVTSASGDAGDDTGLGFSSLASRSTRPTAAATAAAGAGAGAAEPATPSAAAASAGAAGAAPVSLEWYFEDFSPREYYVLGGTGAGSGSAVATAVAVLEGTAVPPLRRRTVLSLQRPLTRDGFERVVTDSNGVAAGDHLLPGRRHRTRLAAHYLGAPFQSAVASAAFATTALEKAAYSTCRKGISASRSNALTSILPIPIPSIALSLHTRALAQASRLPAQTAGDGVKEAETKAAEGQASASGPRLSFFLQSDAVVAAPNDWEAVEAEACDFNDPTLEPPFQQMITAEVDENLGRLLSSADGRLVHRFLLLATAPLPERATTTVLRALEHHVQSAEMGRNAARLQTETDVMNGRVTPAGPAGGLIPRLGATDPAGGGAADPGRAEIDAMLANMAAVAATMRPVTHPPLDGDTMASIVDMFRMMQPADTDPHWLETTLPALLADMQARTGVLAPPEPHDDAEDVLDGLDEEEEALYMTDAEAEEDEMEEEEEEEEVEDDILEEDEESEEEELGGGPRMMAAVLPAQSIPVTSPPSPVTTPSAARVAPAPVVQPQVMAPAAPPQPPQPPRNPREFASYMITQVIREEAALFDSSMSGTLDIEGFLFPSDPYSDEYTPVLATSVPSDISAALQRIRKEHARVSAPPADCPQSHNSMSNAPTPLGVGLSDKREVDDATRDDVCTALERRPALPQVDALDLVISPPPCAANLADVRALGGRPACAVFPAIVRNVGVMYPLYREVKANLRRFILYSISEALAQVVPASEWTTSMQVAVERASARSIRRSRVQFDSVVLRKEAWAEWRALARGMHAVLGRNVDTPSGILWQTYLAQSARNGRPNRSESISFFDIHRLMYDHSHTVSGVTMRKFGTVTPAPSRPSNNNAATAGARDPNAIFTEEDLVAATAQPPPPRTGGVVPVHFSTRTASGAGDPPAPPAGSRAPQAARPTVPDLASAWVEATVSRHRNDIWFLLSSFLGGSKRRQLQDYIAGCGFLPAVLIKVLEVNWCNGASGPLPRIHGPTCTCRHDDAEAVNLLRFLHALEDRDAESSVNRWLSRRRFMSQEELRRAFTIYGYKRPCDGGAFMQDVMLQDNDANAAAHGKLDEWSVLLESVRPSGARPWGWLAWNGHWSLPAAEAGAMPLPMEASMQVLSTPQNWWMAVLQSVWIRSVPLPDLQVVPSSITIPTNSSAPVDGAWADLLTPPVLHVVDPVLLHQNGARNTSSAVSVARSATDVELLVDSVIRGQVVARSSRIRENVTKLCDKAKDCRAADYAPELLRGTDRSLISALMNALLTCHPLASFRGWLCSCIETFLRPSPRPVRRWVLAHGLVAHVVRSLLEEYTVAAIKDAAGVNVAASDQAAGRPGPDSAGGKTHVRGKRPIGDPLPALSLVDEDDEGDEVQAECEADELTARYTLQSMLDLLGECFRRCPETTFQLQELDSQWTRQTVSRIIREATGRPESDSLTEETELWMPAHAASPLPSAVHSGMTLMRLACDRLGDGSVFLRGLLLQEDWAYGLCATEGSFSDAVRLSSLSADEQEAYRRTVIAHPWSWESLSASARARYDVACSMDGSTGATQGIMTTLYPVVHTSLLSSFPMTFVREFRVPMLWALINAVSMQSLTQENMYVLIGGLTELCIAHRHAALPALVQALHDYDKAQAAGDPSVLRLPSLKDVNIPGVTLAKVATHEPQVRGLAIVNFGKLVRYWLEYQSLRERERRSVRISTGYTYTEMRVVARALLGLPVTVMPTESRFSMEGIQAHPFTQTAGSEKELAEFQASDPAFVQSQTYDLHLQRQWVMEPFPGYWQDSSLFASCYSF